MRVMLLLTLPFPALLLFASALALNGAASAEERVTQEADGRIVIHPLPVPEARRNLWPAEWEENFSARCQQSLQAAKVKPGSYGGTFFESEKSSYPHAFIDFLRGNRAPALKFLEAPDNDAWSDQTLGVDWFASFTLKSQTRKYFFFGQYLTPEYRQRMRESASLWTAEDPLRRPNKHWLTPTQRKEKGMTGEGWTPQFHNSWVDIRGTDNLRAMREQAIYLMAEEVGNAATAQAAKQRIRQYVEALYLTGMPEWDSSNYLGHALTGWLPLYDFAKDPEVGLLAKAALDFVCVSAAVKYYGGSWAGPSIRDYGNIGPHAGAAGEFWHYFGGVDSPAAEPYRDFVHVMTSGYRPPPAAVELARKRLPYPCEILASKPSYTGWTQPGGEKMPAHFETTWIGHHTQMGSLPRGHADANGMNLNGFRLMAENSQRGADTLIFFTAAKFSHGLSTATNGRDFLAQNGAALLWLNAQPDAEFHLFLPKSAEVRQASGKVWLRLEKSWIALHPLGLKIDGLDAALTETLCGPGKDGRILFPQDQIWSARGVGSGPCGFALEIGEPETSGSFVDFQKRVVAASQLDLSGLKEGVAHFTPSSGGKVGLRLAKEGLPVVFRNGAEVDWTSRQALWSGETSPLAMGWKTGELTLKVGSCQFTARWRDGAYTFENRR